jgi:hypothetical protein
MCLLLSCLEYKRSSCLVALQSSQGELGTAWPPANRGGGVILFDYVKNKGSQLGGWYQLGDGHLIFGRTVRERINPASSA